MNPYYYSAHLKQIWEKAVARYEDGERNPEDFFDSDEQAFLASIGHSVQEVYDFVEDFVCDQEPDYTTFAQIADVRRFHFLHIQKGIPSSRSIHLQQLPAKSDAVAGLQWLPRILAKAKAKLRGEMPPELMYGCGGDRKFLKSCQIHPAEFLRMVELNLQDDAPVIQWVLRQRQANLLSHPLEPDPDRTRP